MRPALVVATLVVGSALICLTIIGTIIRVEKSNLEFAQAAKEQAEKEAEDRRRAKLDAARAEALARINQERIAKEREEEKEKQKRIDADREKVERAEREERERRAVQPGKWMKLSSPYYAASDYLAYTDMILYIKANDKDGLDRLFGDNRLYVRRDNADANKRPVSVRIIDVQPFLGCARVRGRLNDWTDIKSIYAGRSSLTVELYVPISWLSP
jgi:hypothetical protein